MAGGWRSSTIPAIYRYTLANYTESMIICVESAFMGELLSDFHRGTVVGPPSHRETSQDLPVTRVSVGIRFAIKWSTVVETQHEACHRFVRSPFELVVQH